jgi:hypothetical protein
MKDCILFSGHFRTFEKTKQNIKAFIEENNMDVYCHLWVVNKEEVDIIENELKPVKMSYGYTKEFENSFMHLQERINQKNPKPNNTDNLASQASNHFSRYQAYNLVNKNADYKNLVYCRYDMGFSQVFNYKNVDSIVTPMAESYNIISDIFSIMPFEYASAYFLYNNFEYLHSTTFEPKFLDYLRDTHKYPENDIQIHINNRFCPHMLLLRNLFLKNVPTSQPIDLPLYLQR